MSVQIPLKYQKALEPIEYTDEKTDDEILRSLLGYKPVTSEKNIWTFWDSGINGMPAWCRRNVANWVRICGPEWTIRVLDSDPKSPNYAAKYVPEGLPDAFYNQTMDGTHAGPHSADFLRGACLYEYGGAWMDSSIFLMRHMDKICWDLLEDPSSPYRVAVPVTLGNLLNCFLAARKHDPFIKRW
jgi:mannosyltransferase OCH1-like enzyme